LDRREVGEALVLLELRLYLFYEFTDSDS
jgi:hypothetical protein